MTAIRQCPTGKRPLSGHYANNNPDANLIKCAECGYFHYPEQQASSIKAEAPEIKIHGEVNIEKCFKRAGEVRPMDKIRVGLNHPVVIGLGHDSLDETVTFEFDDFPPKTYHKNTAIFVFPKECDTETVAQQVESLASRRADDNLAQAVREAGRIVNISPDKKETPYSDGPLVENANFGMRAFDWFTAAINMLEQGEWAELYPKDAIIFDMHDQINKLIGAAHKYPEIQHKFAAACRTLESLGYSYEVEGAQLWKPPIAITPQFARHEVTEGELTSRFLMAMAREGIECKAALALKVSSLLAKEAGEAGIL